MMITKVNIWLAVIVSSKLLFSLDDRRCLLPVTFKMAKNIKMRLIISSLLSRDISRELIVFILQYITLYE